MEHMPRNYPALNWRSGHLGTHSLLPLMGSALWCEAVVYAHSYTALYLVNGHWAPYQVPGIRVGWWELLLGKGGGVQWTKAGCPCVRHCPNTANLRVLKTSCIQREGPFIHSHCFPRLLPDESRIFPPIHFALFGCHLGAQWYEEPLPKGYMWRSTCEGFCPTRLPCHTIKYQ